MLPSGKSSCGLTASCGPSEGKTGATLKPKSIISSLKDPKDTDEEQRKKENRRGTENDMNNREDGT